MADERYTRCPGCATVFRVTAEQLAMRAGQVRCGQCKTVFDGGARQVSLTPSSRPDDGAPPTHETVQDARASTPGAAPALETSAETAASAETAGALETAGTGEAARAPESAGTAATGESARAPETAVTAATGESARAPETAGTAGTGESARAPAIAETAGTQETASARLAGIAAEMAAPEDRFAPAASTRPGTVRAVAYVSGIVVLVLLVIGQAAFHFRDAIATFWPPIRPALARLCAVAGCAVRPVRDAAMAHLSIEASDLQADPAHRGLLILTATVRNRAGWPLAYPYLELTLTDAQDRIVVRRVLAPAEYAGGTADLDGGIAPNGEVAIKVFIDASATSQAGYRLYMFYP
jgi:predicted Zn finger-like uncharacterized protein